MQIENIAMELEIFKDNVSIKKFMCPCILLDYFARQYISPGSGYKLVFKDTRTWNPYTKILEI
jgi:hypothetical protein